MSDRQDVESHLLIDGQPYIVNLIHNPTIDDVVITEGRIQASLIASQQPDSDGRRVQRDIRDFLIRLGVER